jgi:phage I-like protein
MSAHEKWARELGATNLKALQDFVAMAQPIPALLGTQTRGRSPAGDRKAKDDPNKLVELAAKYQAEQKAVGIYVDDITAIQHVSKGEQS